MEHYKKIVLLLGDYTIENSIVIFKTKQLVSIFINFEKQNYQTCFQKYGITFYINTLNATSATSFDFGKKQLFQVYQSYMSWYKI